jgi:RNA polymerase II-associated protein 3
MAMFSKVPRFKTVVLLMSTKEKMLVKAVWQKVGVRNGYAAWGIDIR